MKEIKANLEPFIPMLMKAKEIKRKPRNCGRRLQTLMKLAPVMHLFVTKPKLSWLRCNSFSKS